MEKFLQNILSMIVCNKGYFWSRKGEHHHEILHLLISVGVKVVSQAVVTGMRKFAWSTFSRGLIRKKNVGLVWKVVFKLEYLFCKAGEISLSSLNEIGGKSRATIILGKFVNNP